MKLHTNKNITTEKYTDDNDKEIKIIEIDMIFTSPLYNWEDDNVPLYTATFSYSIDTKKD